MLHPIRTKLEVLEGPFALHLLRISGTANSKFVRFVTLLEHVLLSNRAIDRQAIHF